MQGMQMPKMQKMGKMVASAKHSLPMAPPNHPWDEKTAKQRLRHFAQDGGRKPIDWKKYAAGFAVKSEPANDFEHFHMPFADVIDGTPMAVSRPIMEHAQALHMGMHGLTDEGGECAKKCMEHYYEKMHRTPPWKQEGPSVITLPVARTEQDAAVPLVRYEEADTEIAFTQEDLDAADFASVDSLMDHTGDGIVILELAHGKHAMVVQTLIFDKSRFATSDEAVKWANEHGWKTVKVDDSENSWRIRQRDPADFRPDSFRTIAFGDSGIQAVVAKLRRLQPKAEPASAAVAASEDMRRLQPKAEPASAAVAASEDTRPMLSQIHEMLTSLREFFTGRPRLMGQPEVQLGEMAEDMAFSADECAGMLICDDSATLAGVAVRKTFGPSVEGEAGGMPWLEVNSRIFRTGTHKGICFEAKHLDHMVDTFKVPVGDDDWTVPVQLDHNDSQTVNAGHVRRVVRLGDELFARERFVGAREVANVKSGKWARRSIGVRRDWTLREDSVVTLPYIEDARKLSDEESAALASSLTPTPSTVPAAETLAEGEEVKFMQGIGSGGAFKCGGAKNLEMMPADHPWDAEAAQKRVRAWADGDFSMYGQAFMAQDPTRPKEYGAYKLPFADVQGGQLKAVPRALQAVKGVLAGARGGVDLPPATRQAVEEMMAHYEGRMKSSHKDMPMSGQGMGKGASMAASGGDETKEEKNMADSTQVTAAESASGTVTADAGTQVTQPAAVAAPAAIQKQAVFDENDPAFAEIMASFEKRAEEKQAARLAQMQERQSKIEATLRLKEQSEVVLRFIEEGRTTPAMQKPELDFLVRLKVLEDADSENTLYHDFIALKELQEPVVSYGRASSPMLKQAGGGNGAAALPADANEAAAAMFAEAGYIKDASGRWQRPANLPSVAQAAGVKFD